MKFKNKLGLLLIITVLLLSSCGKKEKIGDFSYAPYDDFALSTSAEYSYSAKKIYIEGKLTCFDIANINNIPCLIAKIEESKGKTWTVKIGQAGTCSDENLNKYIGEKIRCFGSLIKKENDNLLLELNNSNEYCIQKTNGKSICSYDELTPSSTYISQYFDNNAEFSIYDSNTNKSYQKKNPGIYISDGMVQDLNNDGLFVLYQKDGDIFEDSYVHYSDADNCIIPITDLKNQYKDGDGVRIYYVIDENSRHKIIYYKPITLDWELNLEDTKAQKVFEKSYPWNKGSITYNVYYTKSSNRYLYKIEALVSDYDAANGAAIWYISRFADYGEYTLSIHLIDSQESFDISNTGKTYIIFCTDESGEVKTGAPDWFNTSNTTDSIALAMMDVIKIDEEFEKEYGYNE